MTKETEIYNTLIEAQQAKTRNRLTRKDQESLFTDKLRDGRWKVTWVLPDDPDHSSNFIDPNKTKKERLELLEQKILDDSITQREVVEYERLKIQLER